jgi:hypothetical protein
MGADWVASVEVGLSDTSLHRLVVSNGTPAAAKMRDMYGHFRTKTQMKPNPGRYWQEDPLPIVSQDAIDLNDRSLDPLSRLHLLRTGSVGAFLIVTRLFDDTGPVTVPFITILAAPSVATYSPEPTGQGLLLDDIWDESALCGFDPTLVTSTPHCPILAAQAGYSRHKMLKPTAESLLLDAAPIVLPAGKLLGSRVTAGTTEFVCSYFLPEVCNFPSRYSLAH